MDMFLGGLGRTITSETLRGHGRQKCCKTPFVFVFSVRKLLQELKDLCFVWRAEADFFA